MQKNIVLDPGHGGRDPGAVGNGLQEAKFVLDFTKKVADHLRRCGVSVVLTRESDKHLGVDTSSDLSARAALAKDADLLVSFHLNSNNGSPGTGYESYVQLGAYVGKQETKRIQLAIHKRMAMAATSYGLRDRGYKEADLAVLRESAPPALLVELAFINNPQDASMLKTQKFVEDMAVAAAAGICEALGVPYVTNTQYDHAKALAQGVAAKGFVSSPDTWEKVIRGEIEPKREWIQGLFENILKA